MQRHTLTPDLFVNERKARTEHIQTETDLGITISKKESKYASRFFAAHHKSTNLAPAKFAFSGKKGASSSKMSKHKAQHMNSCMLYNSKKNNVELLEQPVVAVPQEIRKRRTLSAVVIKNDRVVSKLLNMSLLTSELGGSQLVTSERRESQKTQHRALKDYMSSIDLKMILKMEMDVQISR